MMFLENPAYQVCFCFAIFFFHTSIWINIIKRLLWDAYFCVHMEVCLICFIIPCFVAWWEGSISLFAFATIRVSMLFHAQLIQVVCMLAEICTIISSLEFCHLLWEIYRIYKFCEWSMRNLNPKPRTQFKIDFIEALTSYMLQHKMKTLIRILSYSFGGSSCSVFIPLLGPFHSSKNRFSFKCRLQFFTWENCSVHLCRVCCFFVALQEFVFELLGGERSPKYQKLDVTAHIVSMLFFLFGFFLFVFFLFFSFLLFSFLFPVWIMPFWIDFFFLGEGWGRERKSVKWLSLSYMKEIQFF